MASLSGWGTDGSASVCPFWGIFKRCSEQIDHIRDEPLRPIHRRRRRGSSAERGSTLAAWPSRAPLSPCFSSQQASASATCTSSLCLVSLRLLRSVVALNCVRGVSHSISLVPDALCRRALRASRSRNGRCRIVRRRVQAALSSVGVVHLESRTDGGRHGLGRTRGSCINLESAGKCCDCDACGGPSFTSCWTRAFAALTLRLRRRSFVRETFREICCPSHWRRCRSMLRLLRFLHLRITKSRRSHFRSSSSRRSRLSVSSGFTRSSELSRASLLT